MLCSTISATLTVETLKTAALTLRPTVRQGPKPNQQELLQNLLQGLQLILFIVISIHRKGSNQIILLSCQCWKNQSMNTYENKKYSLF